MEPSTTDRPDAARGDSKSDDASVADATETESYPLSEDDLFHVLQNERRRAVLRYLDGAEETVKMRAIAEQVAAWEHDTTVDQLSSDQRQRVYIALYQSHLDTLDDVGVVEYEKSRGNVRLTDVGQDVATYMAGVDGDETEEDGWRTHSLDYVAAAALSTLLIGGAASGMLGLGTLSSYTVSVLTIVVFAAVTAKRIVSEPA